MHRAMKFAVTLCLLLGVTVGLGAQCRAKDGTQKPMSGGELRQHSGTIRVYVMNGLFGEFMTNAMWAIGQRLRAKGAVVQVGSWTEANRFVADACTHRGDRIVFIGHSVGAVAAAGAVREAKACGARRVSMVGIDPPPLGSKIPKGVHAVVFVGVLQAPMEGAHNIPVAGHGHIGIVDDPNMQSRIVAAALQ
jgi:hypothetical protein